MNRLLAFITIIALSSLFAGCFGMGKIHQEAADATIKKVKDTYGDKVKDIKIYRDKMEIAFDKNLPPMEKAQIFMFAAKEWWLAYPKDKKPGYKLYCKAYDDVISDEDIGSLQMQKGSTDFPRIEGEPGIYSLRDVK